MRITDEMVKVAALAGMAESPGNDRLRAALEAVYPLIAKAVQKRCVDCLAHQAIKFPEARMWRDQWAKEMRKLDFTASEQGETET